MHGVGVGLLRRAVVRAPDSQDLGFDGWILGRGEFEQNLCVCFYFSIKNGRVSD